jgi:septum formation protein
LAPDDLILASRSPQRRAILEQLGVRFRALVPDVEELGEGDPRAVVVENARRKAAAVAERRATGERAVGFGFAAAPDPGGATPGDAPPARILAVDTEVVLGGRVYGKPGDAAEAERFLHELSGAQHEVISGIVVREGAEERSDVAVTRVRFRALSESDVAWYLGTEEWRERAGGYAIQGRGAALVEEIEGDYWNVVGLPVPALLALLPDLLR